MFPERVYGLKSPCFGTMRFKSTRPSFSSVAPAFAVQTWARASAGDGMCLRCAWVSGKTALTWCRLRSEQVGNQEAKQQTVRPTMVSLTRHNTLISNRNPPTPLWRWRRAYRGASATLNAPWHLLIQGGRQGPLTSFRTETRIRWCFRDFSTIFGCLSLRGSILTWNFGSFW